MTGPEHYKEAETFLERAVEHYMSDNQEETTWYIAAAQVHATLALVAAEAPRDNRAWIEAVA